MERVPTTHYFVVLTVSWTVGTENSLKLYVLHLHQQPEFFQWCIVTFHTTPNGIIVHFSTLSAGLNIRNQKGVSFSTLLFIIVVDRVFHQLGPYVAEELYLLSLWLIIIQNITCRLVADLQVLIMYLISDDQQQFLMCLLFLPSDILPFFSGRIVDWLSWNRIVFPIM